MVPKDKQRKLDNGELSLQVMDLPNGKKQYIVVFRTIKPLYVGSLYAQSKIRRVEEKAHKH